MDELVGGSLTLEQRYDIKRHIGRFGSVDIYEGLQRPLDRPIYLHVWETPDPDDPRVARNWADRIRTAAIAQHASAHANVAPVVDFGDIDQGLPFVVYHQPFGKRLSDIVNEDGCLSSTELVDLAYSLAKTIEVLEQKGLSHGGLSPNLVYWDGRDARLLNVGLALTRSELESRDGTDLFGLFSHPPERAVDHDSHLGGDDAFGIAAIVYYAATGNHPLYDPSGKIVAGAVRPLSEFGFEQDFSDKVAAQISAESRDVSVFLNRPMTTDEPVPDERNDDESTPEDGEHTVQSPMQSNIVTVLGAVIFLLIIFNVLTFLWKVQAPESAVVDADTKILPTGYLVDSVPSDAEVIDTRTGNELGRTPLTIDPEKLGAGQVDLKLQRRGFGPVLMSFSEDPSTNQKKLNVRLKEEKP